MKPRIVADDDIALLDEFFSAHASISALPGRKITAADLRDADVLLVRSVTQVNQALLAGSRVKFVGSCTIGTDHLDTPWLQQQGIAWASAPGCNADAVVDYVLACLAALREDFDVLDKNGFTLGIVGCGNVGSRLERRLKKLGITALCCDPFKKGKRYISLQTLLPQCDMVCLHTPLTRNGAYPTHHLINRETLALMKPSAILLNAGRGAVVDNEALLAHLQKNPAFRVALDVWENEPAILKPLLEKAHVATPHIAGYSVEGKRRGTEMIYDAFCQHFAIDSTVAARKDIEREEMITMDVSALVSLREAVLACYDPLRDSEELKHTPAAFDQLRKLYVYRREFSEMRMRNVKTLDKKKLKAVGLKV